MTTTRILLAAGLMLVAVWDSTSGLRCTMNCATVRCAQPTGRRCEPVIKPCQCCPVCASDRGQPCGGIETPCMKKLWCIHATGTEVLAKRSPKWPDPFRGVCGRLFVHTRRHHYHHIRHIRNKHHRELRGKKIYIAK